MSERYGIEVLEGTGPDRGPSFHLRFGECSYVISLLDGRHLVHRYWGSSIGDAVPREALPPVDPGVADYMTVIGTTVTEADGAGQPGQPGQPGPTRFSPDLLSREYPSWGTGELRSPAWMVRRGDGSRAGALEYRDHLLVTGRDALREEMRPRGLPWVRVRDGKRISTVRIDCADPAGGTMISLFYTVIEGIPCLVRWARLANTGPEHLSVEALASVSVDLPARPLDMLTLDGAWARERSIHRRALAPGVQQIESRGGASGHQHAPSVALLDHDARETTGDVWGFSLLYSGNHRHLVEVDQFGSIRVQAGINPFAFSWNLDPGESLDSPAAVCAWSGAGLGGLSDQFHRFVREALLPVPWRDRDRPIVLNTWEACYFSIDAEKAERYAEAGARAGVDVLVLDDGWFQGRNDDTSSLGDWVPDRDAFPRGLAAAAEAAREQGLRLGIWVEPEMVSPDSDLYRAHPDWVLMVPGRLGTTARNQLVLNLAHDAVVDHLTEVFTNLLESCPIHYVKWDMNRNMSEPGSPHLGAAAQGEVMHRYILGLYRLLDRLVTRFPHVLFEGCAGGGGRFDYGMLYWTPQFWTSDQTDAVERLAIQRGSTVLFPPETMGAHVSAVPNHQVGRVTPAWTRVVTSLAFNYGYELDLGRESEEDSAVYRAGSELYRAYRELFRQGRFLRLLPDDARDDTPGYGDSAWAVVSRDGSQAVFFCVTPLAWANGRDRQVRLRELHEDALYRVRILHGPALETVRTLSGAVLMHRGVDLPRQVGDFAAVMGILERL